MPGRWRRGLAVATVPVTVVRGAAGWAGAVRRSAKTVARPDGPGSRCVAGSVRGSQSGGYRTTTAYLVVDGRSVAVRAASNLDPGFSDMGLAVDGGELVRMDRLATAKTAVFGTAHASPVEHVGGGRRVAAQLRCWPEGPPTGSHAVVFSLIGFTHAYDELAGCR